MPELDNATLRPLSTSGGKRRQQLFGLELVISMMRSLVGSDDRPSPFIRKLAEGTQQQAASTELAQDGVILGIKILRVVHGAASGRLNGAAVAGRLIAIVMEAIPELKEDVEMIKAAAEAEADSE